jgi:hypothetical protein
MKRFLRTNIKYIFSLLIFFLLGISLGLFLSFLQEKSFNNNLAQLNNTVSHNDDYFLNKNISSLIPTIPPHVNLSDFYKTYGKRLLGDKNIEIISREEWGVDENICQHEQCSLQEYDVSNTFSDEENQKALLIENNYLKNFKQYDNTFLQTKIQSNNVLYYYLPVEEIIIHHTAGQFTTNYNDSIKELQKIYYLHHVKRGWEDIGYHYLIDGAGRIFEGNRGGKYAVGIHTYYHNNGTLSIALMGDFRPGHDEMSEPMKQSLIKLIQYLIKEYHLDISSNKFYLKKPDLSGREWTPNIIKGHQELDVIRNIPTSCPGIEPQTLRNIIYPYLFQNNKINLK